jgi:hypothetical protein
MGRTLSYIGAGILFLIALCFLGYGALALVGSTSAAGQSNWVGLGAGLSVVGLILIGGGVFLIWNASRAQKIDQAAQPVVMKLDLPGQTKIEQMKCQSCGGMLTADNIKLVNGAPMVTCPFCHSTYQLTEEPKW